MKRINVPIFILIACLALEAAGQQSPTTCIDNWSEFHRSNMQRWNPCETVLNVNNVRSLELKWSFKAGNQPFLDNTPAVVNGVVYAGSGSGNVYALNAETGAMLWGHNIGGVTTSPAVADDVVYVGTDNQGETISTRSDCRVRRSSAATS
jgi:outer membrane protein assembly factor BamB